MLELSLSDGVKWDVKQRSQYSSSRSLLGVPTPTKKSQSLVGDQTTKKVFATTTTINLRTIKKSPHNKPQNKKGV